MKNANKKKQQTLLETFLSTKQEARPGEANNNDQVRPGEANNEIVDLCDSDDDSFSDSFPNKRHKKNYTIGHNNSNYVNTTANASHLTKSPLPLVGKTVSKRVTPEKSNKESNSDANANAEAEATANEDNSNSVVEIDLWPKRHSWGTFVERLSQQFSRKKKWQSKEHQQANTKLFNLVLQEAESFWNDSNHIFWKAMATLDQKKSPSHSDLIYVLFREKDGKMKVGSAHNGKKRVDQQQHIHSVQVLTTQEAKMGFRPNFVQTIIDVNAPALVAENRNAQERLIVRQIAEGIIGCAYPNSCPIFFERILAMPTAKICTKLQMDRLETCNKVCNGTVRPDELLDKKLATAIQFVGRVQDGEKIPQLFSDITLKNQNHKQFGGTAFMKAQRKLPSDGSFLTQNMAMRRCGSKYGDYMDPVPVAPASQHIDECLKELVPQLRAQLPMLENSRKNGDEFIVEPSTSSEIRDSLKPITSKAQFDHFMGPSDDVLGQKSIECLENDFLRQSVPTMWQTQNNNIRAIHRVDSEWLTKNFKTESAFEVYGSTFYETRHQYSYIGNKILVVVPPHHRIFVHDNLLKVRMHCLEDFLFHQDIMVANGFLGYEQALKDRYLVQSYLIHLLYGKNKKDGQTDTSTSSTNNETAFKNSSAPASSTNNETAPEDSFCFARNLVFSDEWFKSALPGIRATAVALGVHEQVFIYLYNKLGSDLMRILVTAFGLMKGNSISMLPPYEPGARCLGIPAYGSIQAKPCVCGDDTTDEEVHLEFCGVRTENHPLSGCCICRLCHQYHGRSIHYAYLEATGQFAKLAELKQKLATSQKKYKLKNRDKHAADQARYKQRFPEKVAANQARQNPIQNLKRNLDGTKRQAKNEKSHQHYQRQKTAGMKKGSGTNNTFDSVNKRYPEPLRNLLKQAVYVFIQDTKHITFANNDLIDLLQQVRILSGLDTIGDEGNPGKYYKCEYSRFISAFLKPLVHENKTRFTTTWIKNDFDPNSTAKISADSVGKTITPALIERIARDCVDKDKYLTEKEHANTVAFGSHETKIGDQVEVDTFELKGSQKTLQLWWDKWFGRGSYPDKKGGVAGRNAKFEAKWRTNNPQRVPKTTYGYVNKIINKISDRVSAKLGETNKREYAQLDEEWHRIAEQEIIPEMEKEFQSHGASVKYFCKSDIFKK